MSADDTNESKEVTADHVPSLDEVNDLTQHKLEQEDTDDTNEDLDEETTDDEDTSNSDEASDDDAISTDSKEPLLPEAESTTELDSDITKPDKDKVAIKAFDGKTFYFNSLDEIPEDFEPANYKALMSGTKALMRKEDADAKTLQESQQKQQQAEVDQRALNLQDRWDKEQKELNITDKKEVDAVYKYMEKKLQMGVPIESFTEAYKAYNYDKLIKEREDEDKDLADRKKARGSRVQGGNSNSNKPIERQAPPTGLSLDAVHAKALRDL